MSKDGVNIDVEKVVKHWVDEITSFNLNARYDDYKREFYSICTPEFTKDWIDRIKTLRIWIKEML